MTAVALAATSHDTEGRLAPAIARSGVLLRELFAGIAINVTHSTHRGVVAAMRDRLGAQVIVHPENEATIGRARRDAVRLALEFPVPAILYCDFDHLMRWAEWIPLTTAMTFTIEAVDARRAGDVLWLPATQLLSTFFAGMVLPFASHPAAWCVVLLVAVATWSAIIPRACNTSRRQYTSWISVGERCSGVS